MFFNPKKETAPNIGIDNKKDIFAASTLLNLRNRAAVIAIPDLLTPGTKEIICRIPIKNADFNEKLFFRFFSNWNLSLI